VETTLQHELVHVVIDTLGGGKMPRWFAEGIALYVAGEGKLIQQNAKGNAMSPYDLEQKLATAKSPAEMKSVYAAACLAVRGLIRVEGEISCGNVWRSEAMMALRGFDSRRKASTGEPEHVLTPPSLILLRWSEMFIEFRGYKHSAL
jgi:hypothetical protein